MATITKNCMACGEQITVRLADHKRGWGKFCDKSCAAAYKCGFRPGKIAKIFRKSFYIQSKLEDRKTREVNLEKAPPVSEQIGKNVKVRHKLHSPPTKRECRECGKITTNGFLCEPCQDHEDAMNDSESGWDGHKVYFGGGDSD